MIRRGMSETYAAQKDKELESIIGSFIAEVKAELGEQASVNEIEATLLRKQKDLMSKLMQSLVANQDFPPSGLNG